MFKSIRSIDSRLLAIKRRLAWFNGALTIDFRSGGGLPLLDFFVGNGLRDHINQELKVVKVGDCACCGRLEGGIEQGRGAYRYLDIGCFGEAFAPT